MKRITLAILSFIYITTATGTSLHFHYCMGELVSWSFLEDDNKKCGRCGMEKKESALIGCCREELKQLKVEIDQKLNNDVSPSFRLPAIQWFTSFHNYYPPSQDTTSALFSHRLPAINQNQSIAPYILLCHFRI